MNIPTYFKAGVLIDIEQPLQLLDLKIPYLKDNQVLVKMHMAGLCRSQLMESKGLRGEDKYLPHLMGHEGVGEVIAVGNSVTKVKQGNRVVLGWLKGSGIDSGGTHLISKEGQIINAGPVTTFSEYSVISENRVTICPEGISNELAVLLGCALPTGAGMVLNQIQPHSNSNVILIGLGGIGISALLMLRHFRPKKIIVVDIEQSKCDLALQLGADEAYLYEEASLALLKEQHPNGFDYAIESAGLCETIEFAFNNIHNSGKCYFASHPKTGDFIKLDPHQLICGKQIFGTWGGNCNPDKDLKSIADIIQKLEISINSLISHRYSLNQINEAISALERREITRAIITFENIEV